MSQNQASWPSRSPGKCKRMCSHTLSQLQRWGRTLVFLTFPGVSEAVELAQNPSGGWGGQGESYLGSRGTWVRGKPRKVTAQPQSRARGVHFTRAAPGLPPQQKAPQPAAAQRGWGKCSQQQSEAHGRRCPPTPCAASLTLKPQFPQQEKPPSEGEMGKHTL